MRRFTTLLLFVCLAATTTFGGGYQVGLHSMRNIGMGLIGTSLSYDASTLFYNPGGAAFVNDKWSFTGGVSFLMARTTFQATDVNYQTHLKHQINTPLYFYAAYKPTKNLSVGIAVNTPYGNSLAWEDNWKGRFLIQNLSFKAFTFQPTVSYKFGNIIGIGVGLVYATGSVDMNKAIPVNGNSVTEGSVNINGSTSSFGFNAGIMIHPIQGLSIGVDYRSKIEMKVEGGAATFMVPGSLAGSFPNTNVDVMLPLPANLDFGVSMEFGKTNQFMLGLNLCYVFWNTYDSLVFNFEKVSPTQSITRSASAALYESRLITRVGFQYKVSKVVTLRCGAYYDPSPVRDSYLNPQTPSADQKGLTCGFSVYPFKGFSIDAAFLYISGSEREGTYSPENFAGTYKNAVYSPGIGLSYSF